MSRSSRQAAYAIMGQPLHGANSACPIMTSISATRSARSALAGVTILRYHNRMDPGSLLIQLLLVQRLAQGPGHIQKVCAQTADPVACYDEWRNTRDLGDAVMMGNWNVLPYKPGSFYHYQDPEPLPPAVRPTCERRSTPPQACY